MSRYFTPKALAQECGVCADTVLKWIKLYDIPCTRIGRITLIKETDFDYWLRRMKRRSQEPANPFVEKLSKELDEFLGVA